MMFLFFFSPCKRNKADGYNRKSRKGHHWNRYKTKKIQVILGTRHPGFAHFKLLQIGYFLQGNMIPRNHHSNHRKRQSIFVDRPIIPVKCNPENDGKWVHENPLIPAKRTRDKTKNLTEIQTAQCGNEGRKPSQK